MVEKLIRDGIRVQQNAQELFATHRRTRRSTTSASKPTTACSRFPATRPSPTRSTAPAAMTCSRLRERSATPAAARFRLSPTRCSQRRSTTEVGSYDNVLFPHAAPFGDNSGLLFSAGSAFRGHQGGDCAAARDLGITRAGSPPLAQKIADLAPELKEARQGRDHLRALSAESQALRGDLRLGRSRGGRTAKIHALTDAHAARSLSC
jgi:hypothetical protein